MFDGSLQPPSERETPVRVTSAPFVHHAGALLPEEGLGGVV
jgi:hypothetical protein